MNEVEEKVIQPPLRGGRTPGVPQYQAGGPRSVRRLENLRYDPIGELVANYRYIQGEIERQEKIRDGLIVELTATGKPKNYRAEVHHALLDKLIAIGDKLLRYGYGRVPETIQIEDKRSQPLIVNLTKKGDVYIANDQPEQEEDLEDD